jgi:hypothetical protein
MPFRWCCFISLVLVMLSGGVALGQEPGVTVEDGPSSKEYEIPLDSARGAAKTLPKADAAQPTPPATTTAEPAQRSTTTPGTDADGTSDQSRAAVPAVPPDEPPSGQATSSELTAAPSDDGPPPAIVIGALALAVLALGGLAGLVLRRRGSSNPMNALTDGRREEF